LWGFIFSSSDGVRGGFINLKARMRWLISVVFWYGVDNFSVHTKRCWVWAYGLHFLCIIGDDDDVWACKILLPQ
jgi:hypothetical protein